MIYLDNAATTKIDDRVLDAMIPYLTYNYGNAGSIHQMGRKAAGAVSKAREQVANLIGVDTDQIIFTSGGSEANNLVFKGLKHHLKNIGKTHIVVSESEHESVLESVKALAEDGFLIHYLPIDYGYGSASFKNLANILKEDSQVGLVSIMFANNETGVVNDIPAIRSLCDKHNVLLHSDCVQIFDDECAKDGIITCDFASMSAHKIHGPKGCGALYCKNPTILSPLISGGKFQEFGLRGGTENVPCIVGFGKACELVLEYYDKSMVRDTRIVFEETLIYNLGRRGILNLMEINGEEQCMMPKIINLRFNGIDAETLLLALDAEGICVSAGSACTSHEQRPSHVLLAMGLTEEEAMNSIRVSFSRMNTESEAEKAGVIIADCVDRLRMLC